MPIWPTMDTVTNRFLLSPVIVSRVNIVTNLSISTNPYYFVKNVAVFFMVLA